MSVQVHRQQWRLRCVHGPPWYWNRKDSMVWVYYLIHDLIFTICCTCTCTPIPEKKNTQLVFTLIFPYVAVCFTYTRVHLLKGTSNWEHKTCPALLLVSCWKSNSVAKKYISISRISPFSLKFTICGSLVISFNKYLQTSSKAKIKMTAIKSCWVTVRLYSLMHVPCFRNLKCKVWCETVST